MPTGYTATLCEREQSFDEFVMRCARAMGACVMMRDDPFDAPIPERFEPSEYHTKEIKNQTERLAYLRELTESECEKQSLEEYQKRFKELREQIAKQAAINNRMNSMLAKVVEWNEPTPDHAGLKEFMADQLRISKDDGSYYQNELKTLKPLSGEAWLEHHIAEAERLLAYHHEAEKEEVERTESRNKWIADLRKSLEDTERAI